MKPRLCLGALYLRKEIHYLDLVQLVLYEQQPHVVQSFFLILMALYLGLSLNMKIFFTFSQSLISSDQHQKHNDECGTQLS